jgi:hypothetical protein
MSVSVTKPCSHCQREHSFPSENVLDDEIICDCGNLIFPSDYGLCERGYKKVLKLYPPEAN